MSQCLLSASSGLVSICFCPSDTAYVAFRGKDSIFPRFCSSRLRGAGVRASLLQSEGTGARFVPGS